MHIGVCLLVCLVSILCAGVHVACDKVSASETACYVAMCVPYCMWHAGMGCGVGVFNGALLMLASGAQAANRPVSQLMGIPSTTLLWSCHCPRTITHASPLPDFVLPAIPICWK